MKIAHATSRSKFLGICYQVIALHTTDLNNGLPVSVSLGSGGYQGHVRVKISSNDPIEFETDWIGSDPTRFPARIKAAATALFNLSLFGEFAISHNNGVVTIKRI